jgi:hypothetical protein
MADHPLALTVPQMAQHQKMGRAWVARHMLSTPGVPEIDRGDDFEAMCVSCHLQPAGRL